MRSQIMHVLLIEDDPQDVELVQHALEEQTHRLHLHHVKQLKDGMDYLNKAHIDVILLDADLPDAQSPESFRKVCESVSDIPVVVLTSLDDDDMAVDAVRRGAQDYIVKDQIDPRMVYRVLCHAIERHQMRRTMEALVLLDELTTLYNRRGFLSFIEQHIKLAERKEKRFLFFLADVDGLKHINDEYGHAAGDKALTQIAGVLKSVFRESDVVARIGGDEFAVLVLDAGMEAVQSLKKRLLEQLKKCNSAEQESYTLSLSSGFSAYSPEESRPLKELMVEADEMLYQEKHQKRKR